jgi:hypothetical protein
MNYTTNPGKVEENSTFQNHLTNLPYTRLAYRARSRRRWRNSITRRLATGFEIILFEHLGRRGRLDRVYCAAVMTCQPPPSAL